MKNQSISCVRVKNLAFLCAVFIACLHCFIDVGRESEWQHWFLNAFWGGGYLGSHGICRVAVPFFFLFSGFFLAAHVDEPNWVVRELKKRMRTILVPYLVFCSLFLVLTLFEAVETPLVGGKLNLNDGVFRFLKSFLRCFGIGFTVVDGPLWYLRTLLVFVAISPIVRGLANPLGLAVTFLGYVILCPDGRCSDQLDLFFRYCISLEGLFYFVLGFYFRLNDARLKRVCTKIGRVRLLIVVSAFVGLIGMTLFAESRRLIVFIIPLMMCGLWQIISNKPWPAKLTSLAFPLYMIHPLVYQAVNIAVLHTPSLGWLRHSVFAMFIYVPLALVVSAMVLAIVRKYDCLSFIFGGR